MILQCDTDGVEICLPIGLFVCCDFESYPGWGSGTYFARAKVGGKLIRQSLGTKNKRIARLGLAKLLRKIPSATPTHPIYQAAVSSGWLAKKLRDLLQTGFEP